MLARTPWHPERDDEDPDSELYLDDNFGRAVAWTGSLALEAALDRAEHGRIQRATDARLTVSALQLVEYFEATDLPWSDFYVHASCAGFRIWHGHFLEDTSHRRWLVPDDVAVDYMHKGIKWALGLTKLHVDRRQRRQSDEQLAERLSLLSPQAKREFVETAMAEPDGIKPVQ
jgi:hypothetical protein